MATRQLGKCPKCDMELSKDDIAEIGFRGTLERHYIYIFRKYGYIIGFSSNAGTR